MVAGGTPPAANGVSDAATSCDAACSECAGTAEGVAVQGRGTWCITSCSLDGGPGGSEAPDMLMTDTLLATLTVVSDSGNERPPSDIGARARTLWWVIICRSLWARSRESSRMARSRKRRE